MDKHLKPEIKELIAQRNWSALKEYVSNWHAPEMADLLLDLDKPDRVLLYRLLPRTLAVDIFSYFDTSDQDAFLEELTDDETRHLLANLPPDDRTALLEELPGQVTQKLLNLLSPEDLKEARKLLGYPEESIGRLMTPDYVAIRPQWTVGQSMQHLRKKGKDSETINAIYVTNSMWKLIGVVSLRQMVLANLEDTIESIMRTNPIYLSAFDDREEAARTMERYDLFVLPVTDSHGVLVGIVTADDVFDVAQEEATEDFHKGAAVAPLKVSIKDATINLLYRNRIGWLLILVFVNLISGGILARFEETIAAVVPLVFFLPLLIASGGNAGSQSATLMVRALAMGDIKIRDWASLLLKEIGVAIFIGGTLSIAVWGLGIYRGGFGVGIVVAMSMLIVVVISSIIGMSVPFLLSKLKMDPAAASSPLITSVADIIGVIVYFTLATWYLKVYGL